jgi:hypothetical protein
VRQFYERVRAIGEIPAPHGSITTPSTPSVGYVLERPSGDVRDDSPASWLETNEFIIFVNGWNTSYDQARTFFAETMFKRLWQRGYRGRFAAFYWPTLTGPDTYNESEYRAWFFGESLKQYASSLSSEYNPSLIAHSMGNIVGGSAFLKGMHLQRYALINAAVPASCYDPNPALQQPYGNTPDHDSDPLTQALAYKNRFAAISTTLINFYLQSDDALELWALNNQLYKPQPFITSTVGDHGYKYFPGNPPGQKLFLSFILNASRTLQQMEESLAYAARSSTKVVGAEGNARGPISKENSIDLARFGYADEHSGFWAFSLQKMATAYDLLMDKLRVERSR